MKLHDIMNKEYGTSSTQMLNTNMNFENQGGMSPETTVVPSRSADISSNFAKINMQRAVE